MEIERWLVEIEVRVEEELRRVRMRVNDDRRIVDSFGLRRHFDLGRYDGSCHHNEKEHSTHRFATIEGLTSEKVCYRLLHHFAVYVRDRACERNVLGADLNAVLRVAAFVNAAIPH